MSDILDFRLDDLAPSDADSEHAERQFWAGDVTVLAERHSPPDGSHSYVVAHDGSVTWAAPGEPQVAAIKVARDLSLNTFTFELAYRPTVSFAQNWLIERGCPPERIAQSGGDLMKPADDLTLQVERQIRESGTRYEVLDGKTSDFDPCEAWTLTRDSSACQTPIRVFLEEGNSSTHTYTLREGAFADVDTARSWLDDRGGPLPEPPEYSAHDSADVRARVALARSAGVGAVPKGGLDAHCTPPPRPVQRPAQQGRLL
ncbi:glycosyl hydrolase [Streptomyces sp. NPDC049944]|uniref:glycosyl hydrolase n=1 Tax=Streptomyces sp. NPDC049944 TaxID=3155657 RepID=UPI0034464423